jgi:hypothetical protein
VLSTRPSPAAVAPPTLSATESRFLTKPGPSRRETPSAGLASDPGREAPEQAPHRKKSGISAPDSHHRRRNLPHHGLTILLSGSGECVGSAA